MAFLSRDKKNHFKVNGNEFTSDKAFRGQDLGKECTSRQDVEKSEDQRHTDEGVHSPVEVAPWHDFLMIAYSARASFFQPRK